MTSSARVPPSPPLTRRLTLDLTDAQVDGVLAAWDAPLRAAGILGDGVFQPRASNREYMTDAFERVFRRFRRQGGSEALAARLEGMARERYGLLGEGYGPIDHPDLEAAMWLYSSTTG